VVWLASWFAVVLGAVVYPMCGLGLLSFGLVPGGACGLAISALDFRDPERGRFPIFGSVLITLGSVAVAAGAVLTVATLVGVSPGGGTPLRQPAPADLTRLVLSWLGGPLLLALGVAIRTDRLWTATTLWWLTNASVMPVTAALVLWIYGPRG
jgi:hypothetical protein